MAVVAALLDWLVCGEEVAPLMDGFLRSYLIRHGLDSDDTLAHFVRDTLASADQDWWVWQEAQWEDKVYAVINVITDVQVKWFCLLLCHPHISYIDTLISHIDTLRKYLILGCLA